MGQARQACQPGSTFTWDNRFILTLASDLSGDLSVAPLGAGGWAICRNALKKRGKPLQANRLAALASPALWQGSRLVHAPCHGVYRCRAGLPRRRAAPDAASAVP